LNTNEMLQSRFRKILVGRHSPNNGSHVADNELLYAPPAVSERTIRHGSSHRFLSGNDHKTLSKFGWVKSEQSEFTVRDFIEQRLKLTPSPEQTEVIFDMLKSIAKLDEGTPVATSFFSRGVEKRRLVLTFHKVIFHS